MASGSDLPHLSRRESFAVVVIVVVVEKWGKSEICPLFHNQVLYKHQKVTRPILQKKGCIIKWLRAAEIMMICRAVSSIAWA